MYKSTNFLANHNKHYISVSFDDVVVGCTKVLISQLITTQSDGKTWIYRCCWMYKSTNFLANHNSHRARCQQCLVVVGCTKVLISQLITTNYGIDILYVELLLDVQKY